MQGAEQDASATVGRADLFDAVVALFEAMAKVGPLLLVIEDAHWADTSTRDLAIGAVVVVVAALAVESVASSD